MGFNKPFSIADKRYISYASPFNKRSPQSGINVYPVLTKTLDHRLEIKANKEGLIRDNNLINVLFSVAKQNWLS